MHMILKLHTNSSEMILPLQNVNITCSKENEINGKMCLYVPEGNLLNKSIPYNINFQHVVTFIGN